MLKKIKIWELKIGMYVVDINHYWPIHPFIKNSFQIETIYEINKLIATGLSIIEIDTAKGSYVSPNAKVNFDVCHLDDFDIYDDFTDFSESNPLPVVPVDPVKHSSDLNHLAELEELDELEYQNAKKLFVKANHLFLEITHDVKMGEVIEIKKITPVIMDMHNSLERNPNVLLILSRIRNIDQYTIEHSISVAILFMTFAKTLKMTNTITIELGIGGFLHDIGKMKVPLSILDKKGKLTENELVIIKHHVLEGFILANAIKGISQPSMDVIMQHHERLDGSGYPKGLKGDEISKYGQMAGIIDVYDAISSDKCYHKNKEPTLALRLLHKWSDLNFDSTLVQQFIKSIGIYPPGSLLLLSNNYLAKVISVGEKLLEPKVKMFMDITTNIHIDPIIIDLAEQKELKIKSVESYDKWDLTW